MPEHERVAVLVVDAANVVGSRPDGWWRDRPGAARRLRDQVTAASAAGTLPYDEIVLVVEGAARRGVDEGVSGGCRVVHAPRSGDDAIVDVVRDSVDSGGDVVVVTADRGLRARVESTGAETVGPGWLLERLGRNPGAGDEPALG